LQKLPFNIGSPFKLIIEGSGFDPSSDRVILFQASLITNCGDGGVGTPNLGGAACNRDGAAHLMV
jgi:hypothetical protein